MKLSKKISILFVLSLLAGLLGMAIPSHGQVTAQQAKLVLFESFGWTG